MLGNVRVGLILSAVILCSAAAAARAQAISAFNLPSQPLAESLKAIGSQTNTNVLVAPQLVDGRQAPALKANLNVDEALSRILAGTGINHKFLNEKTIVLASAVPPKTVSAIAGADDSTEKPGGEQAKEAQTKSFWDRFRVAQVDQGKAQGDASVEKQDEQASKKKPVQLEEVVVTGSRIPINATAGPQDVKIYTRERIERSGQTTVADFLNTLPEVPLSNTDNRLSHSFGTTTVQLHGFPNGTTLVLIDGRRLETTGQEVAGDFFDLNSIPISAVERIEIVSEGTSAVYGSDAIAGVVNIILKKNFDGLETGAKYGHAAGTDESSASMAWGKRWSASSLSIIGSYQTRSALIGAERPLTATNDYTAFGSFDARATTCPLANVYSLDGSNLPGVGAPFAAVPAGFSGTPTRTEFAATAGALNKCSTATSYESLIPESHRTGLIVSATHDLTSATHLFADFLFSYVEVFNTTTPPQLPGQPGFTTFTVSASNPYNPFGIAVGVSQLLNTLGPTQQNVNTRFFRSTIGARGEWSEKWHWELSSWASTDRERDVQPNVLEGAATGVGAGTRTQAALDSTNPSTALNPFIAGPPGSPQLLQTLLTSQRYANTGRIYGINGFVRGSPLQLPAGPVEAVIGTEYDWDSLSASDTTVFGTPSKNRNRFAAFAEGRVPLVASQGTSVARDTLAATIAGRYDHYSDFGDTTNPQFGVEWRPTNTLLIRGTYGRAFKAPPLLDLYLPAQAFVDGAIDPKMNNQFVFFNEVFAGNSKLRPETGASRTLGLVYASEAIPDLQLSLAHWKIDETNVIQTLFGQTIVSNESLFPGRVVRNSAGVITQVNSGYVNFGRIDAAGFDFQLSYKYRTRFGQFTPSIAATQTYRYTLSVTPQAPVTDVVAQANFLAWAPRWKGTVALGWQRGAWLANATGRYVGRYRDYEPLTNGLYRTLGNFWIYDTNLRCNLGELLAQGNIWLKGTYIEFGGVNLFDQAPQFSARGTGVDVAQADLRGRFLYAHAGVKW